MHYNELKRKFKNHFSSELSNNLQLKILLYDIFVYGSAYIVGGYLRDFINSKQSRDIDIIVDLDNNSLMNIIKNSNIKFSVNRHKGIKLKLDNLEVDIWSIDNNWAFKNQLVKLNENDKLLSIAKGCFYNFDALVINLHTFNLNIKFYTEFIKDKKLEILQKSSIYKNLNPTSNANILRAFYLKKIYEIDYSSNTKKYLISKIGKLIDEDKAPVEELEKTKEKYKKYRILSKVEIIKAIEELYKSNNFDKQLYMKI